MDGEQLPVDLGSMVPVDLGDLYEVVSLSDDPSRIRSNLQYLNKRGYIIQYILEHSSIIIMSRVLKQRQTTADDMKKEGFDLSKVEPGGHA